MNMKNFVKNLDAKLIAASVAAGNLVAPLSAHANGLQAWNSNVTGTTVVDGFKSMMTSLATYAGGLYLIGAIFALVLSVRNEDTEGRNKAILNVLAAIALLSFGLILNLFKV